MPASEKSSGRKKVWKDLALPERDTSRSRRGHEEKAERYRKIMDSYRAKASRLHKELLKKKGGSSNR